MRKAVTSPIKKISPLVQISIVFLLALLSGTMLWAYQNIWSGGFVNLESATIEYRTFSPNWDAYQRTTTLNPDNTVTTHTSVIRGDSLATSKTETIAEDSFSISAEKRAEIIALLRQANIQLLPKKLPNLPGSTCHDGAYDTITLKQGLHEKSVTGYCLMGNSYQGFRNAVQAMRDLKKENSMTSGGSCKSGDSCKLLVIETETQTRIAQINVANNKLVFEPLTGETNTTLNNFVYAQIIPLESKTLSIATGGRDENGTIWDGAKSTTISNQDFLWGVLEKIERDFKNRFPNFELKMERI